MKKSSIILLLGVLLLGAGCNKPLSASPSGLNSVPPSNPSEQKTYSSKLFPELTFSYPPTYQVEDGAVSRWVAVKKNDIARIEIFHMKDFGDRPIGFEDTTPTQKDIDGYVPKQQLTKFGFDVWVYYEKDDLKTKDELMRVVDSMLVK
jgi:hypothetical protein